MTVHTVVGALLRANYRSAQAYFQAAKREHIKRYKTWDAELDSIISSEVSRACRRGQGPPAIAAPFPLITIGRVRTATPEKFQVILGSSCPAHPFPCQVIATWGLFREIGVSNITLADIKLSSANRTLRINAPASKADITAIGASVTMCCVCHLQLACVCPYCIGRGHLRDMLQLYGTSTTTFGTTPLFPTSSGNWPTKAGIIEMITKFATAAGEAPTSRRGAHKWGGHAFRRGGVHLLAALGLSREDIKTVARHTSDAIDGYLDGAGLTYIKRILPANLQPNTAPVCTTRLDAVIVDVPWTNVTMARGGKSHRIAANTGKALCGWPWSASFSRCSDAGASVTCRKCFASLNRSQASSTRPPTASSSSASMSGSSASSRTESPWRSLARPVRLRAHENTCALPFVFDFAWLLSCACL